VGLHSQEPLAQRLECRHLFDPVGVEVLELRIILMKHDVDEPLGGDREPRS
jgi:hypothetical protein